MRFRPEDALAEKAQEGDEYASDRLLRDWEPLLERIARRYQGQAEFGEAMSAAYMAFMDALRTYDPRRGCWKDWLSRKVASSVRDASLLAEREQRHEAAEEAGVNASVEETATQSAYIREFLARLPSSDRRLLILHAQGWSLRDIGKRLRLNHEDVRLRIQRIQARALLAEMRERHSDEGDGF